MSAMAAAAAPVVVLLPCLLLVLPHCTVERQKLEIRGFDK